MRDLLALLLVPFLKIAGLRFSKTHRLNNTLVYKLINTVSANQKAGF